MTRRRAHLRLIDSRDVIAAINRAGDAALDPHKHAYVEGSHPFLDNRCARCHRPRAEHWGLLRRLVARLLRRR